MSAASLTDILTTQKNGVVAIGGVVTALNTIASDLGTPALLARTAASLTNTTLYTSPTGVTTYVEDVTICNTSGAPVTVSVALVPLGGTVGASNALFSAMSVAANTTTQWKGRQVLLAGGSIQASASSTSCTIHISGGTSA